jgi:hypothetical protein
MPIYRKTAYTLKKSPPMPQHVRQGSRSVKSDSHIVGKQEAPLFFVRDGPRKPAIPNHWGRDQSTNAISLVKQKYLTQQNPGFFSLSGKPAQQLERRRGLIRPGRAQQYLPEKRPHPLRSRCNPLNRCTLGQCLRECFSESHCSAEKAPAEAPRFQSAGPC